jgi:hypothetical protein
MVVAQEFTQQVTLTKWELTTPEDMLDCLKDLSAKGFRGNVNYGLDQSGNQRWILEIIEGDMTVHECDPTQVVVNSIGLEVLSPAEFTAKYGSAG